MERVPGFLSELAEKDLDFGRVKDYHVVSTNKFIEWIRLELKNKIKKVKDEVADGKLKVPDYDDDYQDEDAMEGSGDDQ